MSDNKGNFKLFAATYLADLIQMVVLTESSFKALASMLA
jgi:hypothetical protein